MNEIPQYKKWLLSFVVSQALLFAGTCYFNYRVDSAAYFQIENLEKAADANVKGNIVADLENYDERKFQELIIQKEKTVRNVIVTGSSRSMMVRSALLKIDKHQMYNHSVF